MEVHLPNTWHMVRVVQAPDGDSVLPNRGDKSIEWEEAVNSMRNGNDGPPPISVNGLYIHPSGGSVPTGQIRQKDSKYSIGN